MLHITCHLHVFLLNFVPVAERRPEYQLDRAFDLVLNIDVNLTRAVIFNTKRAYRQAKYVPWILWVAGAEPFSATSSEVGSRDRTCPLVLQPILHRFDLLDVQSGNFA